MKRAAADVRLFYCGNDAAAKNVVARIVDQFGWDGADMGTAKAARAIEPLCQLWCIPGFRENAWTNHAFALLLRRGRSAFARLTPRVVRQTSPPSFA